MKKIAFIFFISILTSILLFFGYNFLFKVNLNDERSAVKIGNKEYFLDVARTDEEKRKGLAKFENIKDNEGMIFIFDTPGRYSFYMKDMKFNIDIIFLDQNKKVVDLFKNVQFKDYKNPYDYEVYKPNYDSKFVIELKAGEIDRSGIKPGDKIDFSLN